MTDFYKHKIKMIEEIGRLVNSRILDKHEIAFRVLKATGFSTKTTEKYIEEMINYGEWKELPSGVIIPMEEIEKKGLTPTQEADVILGNLGEPTSSEENSQDIRREIEERAKKNHDTY